MWLLSILLACPDPGQVRQPGDDVLLDSAETGDTSARPARCPEGSVDLGSFCIDAYEAALEVRVDGQWQDRTPYGALSADEVVRAESLRGRVPQAYVSAEEAAEACETAGKRLCTSSEWLAACQGAGRIYPYGDTYDAAACNDTYAGTHPVVDYFGSGRWDPGSMNDPGINQQPDSLAAAGAFAACVTPEGVHDLHGNLHEWVDESDGAFRGGFYADASINGTGCAYVTTAHSRGYHDYSTGFRCCADPREE